MGCNSCAAVVEGVVVEGVEVGRGDNGGCGSCSCMCPGSDPESFRSITYLLAELSGFPD